MSSPPPVKPPRGVKQGKETSGLLMSVIRTLSASETNDQRDQEKAKLEKEYKKSDQRLDELVSRRSNELTQVMQVFGGAWAVVGGCRERVRAARARLAACGNLLRVRRADLRRLWADSRQHKHALDMLTQIEQLVSVDKEISTHLTRGHFLNAATTLQSALTTANTSLAEVEALQHLRMELENKKQSLVERISILLSDAVYKADIDSLGLRRQGSSRDKTQAEMIPKLAELPRYESLSDDHMQDITPEFELTLADDDKTMKLNMAILVESLAVMDKIKESTENLKVQIQNELLQIIAIISQQVIDYGSAQLPLVVNGPNMQSSPEVVASVKETDQIDPQYLLIVELLTSLLEHFKTVAQRQSVLLGIWENTIIKYKAENIKLYTMHHYWSQVQAMLQLLLTDYLDIQNLSLSSQRPNFTDQPATTDINFYFMKKKSQTKRKVRLFKFNNSEAAVERDGENASPVSVATAGSRGKTYQLVSRPKPDNLPHIYHILEAFMCEIETNSGRGECSLRVFITDYIKTTEAERLCTNIQNSFEAAVSEPGAWRELVSAPNLPNRANGGMIFKCCVQAWRGIYAASRSLRRLQTYSDYVVRTATIPPLPNLLSKARTAANHLAGAPAIIIPVASPARGISGTPTPAPRMSRASARSAAWLADDDIIRFLKSLPNWTALKTPISKKKKIINHILDQDMKQSYEREAEILGSSLGDGTVQRKEIISSSNTLKDIAVMCESMDWLSSSIKALPNQICGTFPGQTNIPNGLTGQNNRMKLSDRTVNELSNSAAGFEELSDICLLLLHLELRIQCFHYLSQDDENAKVKGSTPLMTESGAMKLASTIQTFYEDTLSILQTQKMNYIFHGLGEMMSAAILSRCHEGSSTGAANNSAVSSPMGTPVRAVGASSTSGPHAQRLAALRHCLAAIGQPPDGLHRAALYLEMLNMSPDEILRSVAEKGPMFSDLEYLNAFKIIGKSRNQSEADVKVYLTKLSNILGNVGVTV